MKHQQYITVFSLIMALSGLTPLAAAEILQPKQMDKIYGGMMSNETCKTCPNPNGVEKYTPGISSNGAGCIQCPSYSSEGASGANITWDRDGRQPRL